MTSAADTIFALSSGPGKAGVAVVRLSGAKAGAALQALAGSLPPARHAKLRKLKTADGDVIDQALALWFQGPASFTGEDMAELHVHGSAAVLDALFMTLGSLGLRAAEPGEFTRRAFANGKIDLVEAEGLADLLSARTEAQRKLAVTHLLGQASSDYETWRAQTVAILARLEAAVDFVDEEGVAEDALSSVRPMTEALIAAMRLALAEYGRVRPIRDGVRVVLAGPPNAGKSSLLNRLAKREAAIVSPIPGTTRDAIEVMIDLGGMAVVLTDTAGLRDDTGDVIEAMGMARSRDALAQADVVVWVTSPDCMAEPPAKPLIHIRNKNDLFDSYPEQSDHESISVSAKTGEGFEIFVAELEREVASRFGQYEHGSIVRERHRQAVTDTVSALERSLTVAGPQIELAAESVRNAARALGRVTGKIDVEDLLDHIFREFCIGK